MAQPVPIDVDFDEQELPRRAWLGRAVIVLLVIGLLAAAIVAVRGMLNTPEAPRRQIAKIAILPDTPPPPPPKEEPKKEPPKDELRPQTQPLPQQKQDDTPPPPAPIKMEGAAGDGPSPFAAGSVSKDYKEGTPTVGTPTTAQGGTASDRAQERFYANSVRQLLREGIERNLRAEAGELTATFAIWVEGDGSLARFEITPSGDPARDSDLRSALEATSRSLKLPPPGALGQPMRFRLTVRALG